MQWMIQIHLLTLNRTHLTDIRIAEIPRWSGLTHFGSLMKTSDFTDGRKYEDISKVCHNMVNHSLARHLDLNLNSTWFKVIIYGSHNVLDASTSPEGYQLLILMRSYLELDMYASLTMHTEATLVKGQEELVTFDKALQVLLFCFKF